MTDREREKTRERVRRFRARLMARGLNSQGKPYYIPKHPRPKPPMRKKCEIEYSEHEVFVLSHACEGLGRTAFKQFCHGAYMVAVRNGWLDRMPWLGKKENPFRERIHCVYVYRFNEYRAVYVGLTMQPTKRHHRHMTSFSSAREFAEAHGIPMVMDVLYRGLSITEAQEMEAETVSSYASEGWNILNRAKVGVNCGSVGGGIRKWTRPRVFEVSKRFCSRGEFSHGCPGAYEVARLHGWLSEMDWLVRKVS